MLANLTVKSCPLTYCRLRKCLVTFLNCRRKSTRRKTVVNEAAIERGWEPVIGLEIHAQIQADSKIFSGAGTRYGEAVNTQVSFMDSALPGTLPVLNRRCVEAGIITALALNSRINHVSFFDRKHYFYADMPLGYQITQQRRPLAQGGELTYLVNNVVKHANIHQIQLEQDSGKSLHDPELRESLIDLNRAGVGLMEIVTDPDFTSSTEARAFIKELQLVLTTLNTCSCVMAEGKLRVDASISLHRPGSPLGTRCEVKNLNSIGFMEKAIDFEILRQLEILEAGKEVENQTRMFESERGETVAMRDKEKVHDYRFMPEPNLLPLRVYDNTTVPHDVDSTQIVNLDIIRDAMPVLPMEKRKILVEKGVGLMHASQIVNKPGDYELFCKLVTQTGGSANSYVEDIVLFLLPGALKQAGFTQYHHSDLPVTWKQLTNLISLQEQQLITRDTAFQLLTECAGDDQFDILQQVETRDLKISHSREDMETLVDSVLQENMATVGKFQRSRSDTKRERYTKTLRTKLLEKSPQKYDPNILYGILEAKLKALMSK